MTDETQPTDTQVNEEITKNEDKNDTEFNKESEREARFNSEDILRKRRERFGIEDEPESANRPQIGDVELDQIKPPKKVRKTEQPKKPEAAPTSSSYEVHFIKRNYEFHELMLDKSEELK